MSIGTVYGQVGNPRFVKLMITADLSEVVVDTIANFSMKDTKSEAYKAKFPLGQAPAFETKDGKFLTESSAIAQYIAEQKPNNLLLGQDSWERAEITRSCLIGETQLLPNSLELVYPLWGLRPYNEQVIERSSVKVEQVFKLLDEALQSNGGEFICLNRLTLADIELVCALTLPFCSYITPEKQEQFKYVTAYFKKISQHPTFLKHNVELERRGYSKGPIEYKKN